MAVKGWHALNNPPRHGGFGGLGCMISGAPDTSQRVRADALLAQADPRMGSGRPWFR